MLVSTSGNQRYVFASNKLREAVGASHLLALSTTDWVRHVLPVGAKILQESSGTTLVQVEDEAAARSVAHALTSKALREAPGLDVSVVSVDVENDVTSTDVDKAFAEAHRNRSRHPSGAARFSRMPVVASCASTDLPARAWHSDERPGRNGYSEAEQPQPLAAEVIEKRRARRAAVGTVERLLADHERTRGIGLIEIDDYFESVEWSAVVHADGNRLGELFQTAIDQLDPARIRDLSQAVDEVAKESFRDAVAKLAELTRTRHELPIVPLIIGGDDLTMLVTGEFCLDVVDEYLRAFSKRAAAAEPITQALWLAGRPALTVSAGVAIVKPHFPFSVAYRLSEELCQSAKRDVAAHPGCHGLDVHVLLDSVITSLDAIRTRYRTGAVDLTQRPYLLPAGDQAVPRQRDWRAVRRQLHDVPDGLAEGSVVTRTQLHALREELRTDLGRAQRRITHLAERAERGGDPTDVERVRAIAGDPPRAYVDGSSAVLDLLELSPFVTREGRS
jgi:hypothetical protein